MLSYEILEELVRATPMSEYLIKEAWPNLSTESRLQIIQTILRKHGQLDMSGWLSVLALNDEAPIVRYWAARSTIFCDPERNDQGFFVHKLTEEDKQLYAMATIDSSELVRLCADKAISFETLSTATQFQRLVFLRGPEDCYLGLFFEWLDAAIDAGVPDGELSDCAREFLARPDVQEELTDKRDFVDGMADYLAGQDIKTAWRVAKKAGVRLQQHLAYVLPTRMGILTKIEPDELAQMPEGVLIALLSRWRWPGWSSDSQEIDALIALMHEHPKRFPKSVIKELNREDGMRIHRDLTTNEQMNARARQDVNRAQATLDTLIRLDEKVTALGDEKLTDLKEQIQTTQAQAANHKTLYVILIVALLLMLLRSFFR